MIARLKVILTAAPTYLTSAAAIVTIFASEIAEIIPGQAEGITEGAVVVVGVLTVAINIIRRVTPVLPSERGLL
jgi:hypothetical protein